MILKTLVIIILIASISAVHLLYTGPSIGFHVLHQQLFYIPLVFAAFWFGVRAGLITAAAVSFLYGPAMIMRHHEEGMHLTVSTQIALYLVVSLLIGWLSDRHRRQQQEMLKNERVNALGKAALTLGFEIGDIVRGVESICRQAGGLKDQDYNAGLLNEINRLQKMVDGLGHFGPAHDRFPESRDLNNVLRHVHKKYRAKAAEKGVKMTVQPHEPGCPSTVQVDSLTRIYDALVENALDFSRSGQVVILRSAGSDRDWVLEVADEGPGVANENLDQLFTAFFTTRSDGYGLSLSSGRKVLRDLGGDLVYRHGESGGAVFSIHVPRD